MIRNYFKTAWRSILKNKATSAINLFGLSVGMTAAVFIFLWVQSEMTVDDYHPDKDNIYRITNSIQVNNDEAWVWENSPMMMAEFASREIPEIGRAARLVLNAWGGPVLSVNHQMFPGKTSAYIDKNWFSLFHYDFVTGNATAFGEDAFSVILTESKAKKYFGVANPVGQVIKVDTVNYTVKGIVKDNPVNSGFQFDVMMQMDGRLADEKVFKNDKTWNNFGYITFLQLRPDAKRALVESKLNALINKNRSNNNDKVSIRPLGELYFETDLQSSEMPHGSKKATYIFCLLGVLLLITACINYVNLTTAKASLRAKEVSIRKIAGAKRVHLFFQFIAESLIISLLSLLITLALVQLCLPLFNSITEKQFELPVSSLAMWQVLLATLLFAIFLNGIYPAVLLSSFKPLNVFRGKSLLKVNDAVVRKGLVVFQFSLSMMLIVATIVIYRQLNFIQTTDPGYNVSQVMSVQVPYRNYAGLQPAQQKLFFANIKQQLLSQSSIVQVSNGNDEIINVTSASSGNADWDGRDTTYEPTIAHLTVDTDFKQLFQLQLKEGNWFRPVIDKNNYILNETAVTAFNLHQPLIGQRFTWGGDTGQVIAVVKDFHYKNLHEKIGPMVIAGNEGSGSYFFIKTAAGNTQKAIAAVSAIWAQYIPAEPFTYHFLDDSFDQLYKIDIKTSSLIFIFSIIAVIISALGLFGLAAFTAEQRTREIGIRKVLGASVRQITTLLSKDFVRLVAIAIVIASPVALWVMNKWLQDFAYRISITVGIFIAAGLLALIVAIVSVSIQAVKTAVANPVKSLRTE